MAARVVILCVAVIITVAVGISTYFHFKHHHQNPPPNNKDNSPIIFNAIIFKTKLGVYGTIMDAIIAAPTLSSTKYYIHVEAGVYTERVDVWTNKTNIALVGDGEETTKVSWNRRVPDFTTLDTATVAVRGKGFLAMNMAFENTAGDGSQAVALLSESDQSVFYICTFLGFQDTLYAIEGVQFYRECNIYGTVDFVFGSAVAVFQPCNLFSRLPKVSTFTAQQRLPLDYNTGFVLQNCKFTVAPGMESVKPSFEAYLGRPWSNYSTVVVMESYLDSIIEPSRWLYWEGRTTDLLTYIEFHNYGPGASTDRRVDWKGYRVVNQRDELQKFTVAESEFIHGDE